MKDLGKWVDKRIKTTIEEKNKAYLSGDRFLATLKSAKITAYKEVKNKICTDRTVQAESISRDKLILGKWYKVNPLSRGRVPAIVRYGGEDEKNMGTGYLGTWTDHVNIHSEDLQVTLANPKEIKTALRAGVSYKGYKVGSYVENHQGIHQIKDMDLQFNDSSIAVTGLHTSSQWGIWLVMNGVWAEIVEAPKEPLKVGQWYKYTDSNTHAIFVTELVEGRDSVIGYGVDHL